MHFTKCQTIALTENLHVRLKLGHKTSKLRNEVPVQALLMTAALSADLHFTAVSNQFL